MPLSSDVSFEIPCPSTRKQEVPSILVSEHEYGHSEKARWPMPILKVVREV